MLDCRQQHRRGRLKRLTSADRCAGSAPIGCLIGRLYPKWPSKVRAGAGGDCLQASAAGGFGLTTPAEWLLLEVSTLRLARVGRAAPPHAPAAIPRFAPLRLRWRRTPFGCLIGSLYPKRNLRSEKYLRPQVARASRPPSAGSDTRRCSCLRAGRLTQSHWIFYWQYLPLYSASCCSLRPAGSRARRRPLAEGATRPVRDRLRRHRTLVEAANKRRNASDSKSRRPATLPLRRAEISHRSIGRSAGCDPKKSQRPSPARIEKNRSFPARRENPVQKQSMLLNDFPPYPRRAVPLGTRNGQPLPLQVSTPKRELPSGRAGPACPRRAMGSLYPE